MTDLNVRFDEFVEKLNHMSVTEFDNMLIRCGIERIKPSVDSNYVCCLKKTFRRQTRNILSDQYLKRMYVICIIILSWTVLDKE